MRRARHVCRAAAWRTSCLPRYRSAPRLARPARATSSAAAVQPHAITIVDDTPARSIRAPASAMPAAAVMFNAVVTQLAPLGTLGGQHERRALQRGGGQP